MYKCPRCSQDLFCVDYLHNDYGCLNFNCLMYKSGNRWSQDFCERRLKPGGREVKEVRSISLFDGEMFEIWFPLAGNPKGYFKASIQPIVDIIKAKVPITSREYNPDSKHWTIAKEYYYPIIEVMRAMGFKITVQDTTKQDGPKVHVPEDYAENFYRSEPQASAGTEDVAEKLSQLLQIADVSKFDADDLKKIYRIKARKYHPDLGGDAAKMSELNRLWSLFNAS